MKKTFQLSTRILFAVNGGLAFSQTLCELEPDPGPCFAAIQAYYINADSQSCSQFTWGGCDGIVPFWTLEECQSACGSDVFNPSELCDSIHVSLSSVIQPDMGGVWRCHDFDVHKLYHKLYVSIFGFSTC